MKAIICPNCGSTEFIKSDKNLICCYCDSKFTDDTVVPKRYDTQIVLNEDVLRLLDKCKAEPQNARRYARLILDIDPCNDEALNYLY